MTEFTIARFQPLVSVPHVLQPAATRYTATVLYFTVLYCIVQYCQQSKPITGIIHATEYSG